MGSLLLNTGSEGHAMPNPVLCVKDLAISFHSQGEWREVVHKVSFDIRAGETIAVVGEADQARVLQQWPLWGCLTRERCARTDE